MRDTVKVSLFYASAALLCAAMFFGTANASRHESRDYIGVIGDGTEFDTSRYAETNLGIGGAIFEVHPSDSFVSVMIDDAADWRVGGVWQFQFADGRFSSYGLENYFCAGIHDLPVPAGAVALHVGVDEAGHGPYDCGFLPNADTNAIGAGTYGTIEVEFE